MAAYNPNTLASLYRKARGIGENALSMLTSGFAEPVAGFASLAALARGENAAGARDAVRDAFTYSPRTAEGQGQQRMLGELAQSVVNSAPVRTWQRGVDFAGRASPVAGATLQTVPAALGALTGYKPAMQTGQAVSQVLAQAQAKAMENAMMPRTLHPQRGVFAGTGALKADHAALASAKEMAKNGASPDDIWRETGWLMAPDGKWRFEIDDRFSSIKSDSGLLSDVIDHPELFENYPQLKRIIVDNDNHTSAAAYDSGAKGADSRISTNPKYKSRSLLLHEIQHAIQNEEGFDQGGSPSQFERGLLHNGRMIYGDNAYNQILGEVEARIAQGRLEMLPERYPFSEYRDIYPYERGGGLDIHPDNIIVRNKK